MKKIYQINKKYKIPIAVVLILIGSVGLLIPIIPGLVLIGIAIFLLKDFFKPKEIIEGTKEVAEKTAEVLGDVGEEVEKQVKKVDVKRGVKRINRFVRNIRKKFIKQR